MASIDSSPLEYWRDNFWTQNSSPWQLMKPNPFLVDNFTSLIDGIESPRILVPLCGKTMDLTWLMDQPGVTVIGIEGVIQAIQAFQSSSGLKLTQNGDQFKSADGKLKILNRNLFHADAFEENNASCVWDRAALVAVSPKDREKYVETMKRIIDTKNRFNYLLNVVEYDTSKVEGPPHLVTETEVENLFGSFCSIRKLSEKLVPPTSTEYFIEQPFIEANIDCTEVVYLLTNKS